MGKRSSFERVERDFYRTPCEGVYPLLPHLSPGTRFMEPCAGDGALVDHLRAAGHRCLEASDIDPKRPDIRSADVFEQHYCTDLLLIDCFITNPPWTRSVLHPLIVHLSDQAPTWLLFDADWSHTRQAAPYLLRLRKIVSVGRLKWIPGSHWVGKDNCAWHLFTTPRDEPAEFYGRSIGSALEKTVRAVAA